jgi:signal transduction histidine kinase
MRSTFVLVLVTLLLAFYAILGLTFYFFPPKDTGTPENSGEALKTSLLNEAFLEHEYYLNNGCKSHLVMGTAGTVIKLVLPTQEGGFKLLCGETPSPAFTAILHRALETQSLATGPDGAFWVIAYPFSPPQNPSPLAGTAQPGGPNQSKDLNSQKEANRSKDLGHSGKPFPSSDPRHSGGSSRPDGPKLLIAQYSPLSDKHPWPYTRMLVPLSLCALLTLLLAYSFSRPLRELRAVVRSFASGKMDARVPEPSGPFITAGSYEMHSLMIDFNQMADRIAGLMEAQKLLLRDVSHELRSPLARLSVALELTRDEAPPSAEIHLQRIEDEANQLNRLIGELLSLSSLESLHGPVAAEPISIVQLIEAHLPNLQFEAQARGCSVSLSALTDSQVAVDAKLMGRAIENIVRNAIRYSPAGANVDLEVVRLQEQELNWSVLRIMDHGPGVPEEMREAIFRPFVRVDSSRNENTGGFGVGLAIAERAIHLHGGMIKALPRPGGGLIVEVRIPAQSDS